MSIEVNLKTRYILFERLLKHKIRKNNKLSLKRPHKQQSWHYLWSYDFLPIISWWRPWLDDRVRTRKSFFVVFYILFCNKANVPHKSRHPCGHSPKVVRPRVSVRIQCCLPHRHQRRGRPYICCLKREIARNINSNQHSRNMFRFALRFYVKVIIQLLLNA